jgi:hypothetical protein
MSGDDMCDKLYALAPMTLLPTEEGNCCATVAECVEPRDVLNAEMTYSQRPCWDSNDHYFSLVHGLPFYPISFVKVYCVTYISE